MFHFLTHHIQYVFNYIHIKSIGCKPWLYFKDQEVKMNARIGVQPPPTHSPFTMNDSLVLQQQQQYQYRQLFLK